MLDDSRPSGDGHLPVPHPVPGSAISPDAVTLVGHARCRCRGAGLLPAGDCWQGVLVITAFVFSDLIDGQMARRWGGPTSSARSWTRRSTGSATAPSSAAWRSTSPGRATATSTWCCRLDCLVMGAVTSYARARAESLGFEAKVGIAERADRLVAILVMTGFARLSTCRSSRTSRSGRWRRRARSRSVQRIWVVRRQAFARPARPERLPEYAVRRPRRRTIEACLRHHEHRRRDHPAAPAPPASSAAWPRCSRAA